MNKSTLLRISYAVVAFFVLSWMPSPVFAQRGGGGHGGGGGFHGGGGGFHGGGGGFHSSAGFHGGGSFQGGRAHYGYGGSHYYGGYRGGGSYGWRGGYYGHGWRGRYWGYPGYGYGWGFGWGWPYWSPYGYGYGPWWGYPYSYYYPSCTPGYDCPSNGNDDPPPSDFGPQSKNYSPNNGAEYESSAPVLSVDRITAAPNNDLVASSTRRPEPSVPIGSIDRVVSVTPSSYRVTHHSKQHNPAVRPEVQNAMRALHEMPPFAREREIETGRYSHFSAPEKKLLRSVS